MMIRVIPWKKRNIFLLQMHTVDSQVQMGFAQELMAADVGLMEAAFTET